MGWQRIRRVICAQRQSDDENLGSLSVSGVDYGIYLFAERSDDEAANSNLWIRNGGSADRAVKIRSEGKGIYLQSTPGAARLTVDGDVDIEAPSGIVVDRVRRLSAEGKLTPKAKQRFLSMLRVNFT